MEVKERSSVMAVIEKEWYSMLSGEAVGALHIV